ERLKKTQQRLLDSGATIVTTNMPDTIAALRRGRSFGCLDSRHTPAEPHWHDQPQSTSPLTEV
ncbi:MAG: hypothetical protein ABI614_22115, partial [Planctomycetota bacterium]